MRLLNTFSKFRLIVLGLMTTTVLLVILVYTAKLRMEWQLPLHQAFLASRHKMSYRVLLEPQCCNKGTVNLLLALKSHSAHIERRQALRRTWGQERWLNSWTVRRIFLLGQGDEEVLGESERYGDLLQWDFHESFFNVTLKEVAFWHWYMNCCSSCTHYILKGDDDVFVDVDRVLEFLQSQPGRDVPLYTGRIFNNTYPVRLWWSKYYIPYSMYKGIYPPYMGGGGYLVSQETIRLLLKAATKVPLFPIDDAYVGMCAQKANITALSHPGIMPFEFSPSQSPCSYWGLLVLHPLQPAEQYRLWKFYKEQGHVCKTMVTLPSPSDSH